MVLRAHGGGRIRLHAARLRAPLAGVPGLRQYQVVPGEQQLTLRFSIRREADAEMVRAHAADVVRSALRTAGADMLVTTELVDVIERAGTGAKEKLVCSA